MKEFDIVLERAKRQAKEFGLVLNPDKKVVEAVIKGLIHNKKIYGYYYCLCKLEKVAKNVCMCKDVRTGGDCLCGLFIKK